MKKQVVLLKARVGQQGGLEKYAIRIARGFLERDTEVSLLTTGEQSDFPGVSVHTVNTCRWPAFWRMEQYDRFVQEWLDKHGADLVFGMDRNRFQTHFRAGSGVHAAFLKSRIMTQGRMKWITCLFNPLHQKILELERAAFENPKLRKLFTNSDMVRKEILTYYRTDPAKIEVIHNGVEWHEMERDFQEWPLKKEGAAKQFGLDPSQFHFLFIGNGYLRKGLTQLLHAFARLSHHPIHLSVIGKDNHSERFQILAEELNLGHRVTFFGHQKAIRSFYQLADALVIPSFYDPFANVTVEALAMGLFVISSKSNGGHEILTPENGAVIDDLLDPDSIAAALLLALNRPKTELRANVIRESVRHLDFSNQIPRLIDACIPNLSESDRSYAT